MKVTPFTLVLCALPLADATRATPRLRAPFILRGGAVLGPLLLATPAVAGTTAASLINCVGGASSFFGNIRVPAALLAGASLGQMFAATDESRGKWVPSVFSVLTALTAMLEIGVVFTSTATATALLGGGFNPMAVDPISFGSVTSRDNKLASMFRQMFCRCRSADGDAVERVLYKAAKGPLIFFLRK